MVVVVGSDGQSWPSKKVVKACVTGIGCWRWSMSRIIENIGVRERKRLCSLINVHTSIIITIKIGGVELFNTNL